MNVKDVTFDASRIVGLSAGLQVMTAAMLEVLHVADVFLFFSSQFVERYSSYLEECTFYATFLRTKIIWLRRIKVEHDLEPSEKV